MFAGYMQKAAFCGYGKKQVSGYNENAVNGGGNAAPVTKTLIQR